eukprot:6487461-Amphidinium_carterae.1
MTLEVRASNISSGKAEACQEKAPAPTRQIEQALEGWQKFFMSAYTQIKNLAAVSCVCFEDLPFFTFYVLAQDLCVCSVVVVTMFGNIIVIVAACGIALAQEALVETGSQPGVVAVLFPNVTTEQEKRRVDVAFDAVYEAFNRSFNETWQTECFIRPLWRSLRVRADSGMRSTVDSSMSHCDKGSSQVVCTCAGKSIQNSYTFAFGLSARL